MSNPSEFQIDHTKALPSQIMLGLKPTAPNSRSYRVNITPNNKQVVFSPSDVIYIDIPTGRHNTFYDPSQSYLKFSVQFASTSACASTASDGINIDNSAYSFFQRLDTYNGSNQLETKIGYI